MSAPEVDLGFLAGGGSMGERIRAHPWASSSLGAPDTWPQALRTTVRILLTTGHPTMIFWGPELDIGMPDLSGYEVAQELRREPWGTSVQLIAVTGWGQDDDKRRAVEAGFDHHLTKPVDPERLAGLIVQRPPRRGA